MDILVPIRKNVLNLLPLSPSVEFLSTGCGLIRNLADNIAVEAWLNFYGSREVDYLLVRLSARSACKTLWHFFEESRPWRFYPTVENVSGERSCSNIQSHLL